jgi:hypothetical protein
MVTLRHTSGLDVPHDWLRVGSVSRRSTHNGEAVTAQLTINGLIVGMIENDGNGGLTELFSPNDLFGWRRMHAYRIASLHHGQPIEEHRLLDALVTEAELDKALAGLAPGATLARLIDAYDYTVATQPVAAAPHTAAAERLLAATLPPGRTDTRWQTWSGHGWSDLSPS